MEDSGCCFICGKPTDDHIYKSERGEDKIYRTCNDCESELRK